MLNTLISILLAMWVYSLHNKLGRLQKMITILLEDREYYAKEHTDEQSTPDLYQDDIDLKDRDEIAEDSKIALETEEFIVERSEPKVVEEVEVYTEIAQNREASSIGIFGFIKEYFTQGNLLVRVGGVILFFGLAFLVKYAAEHSVISMEIRLLGVVAVGVGLMILGWRLREREGSYGLILQGLGIATLYLVIFSAAKFFALLPLNIAFLLMLVTVVIGSILSVIQNSLSLALFATAGGFLVPILTSDGSGSHQILFSYYALLNIGIFIMAWYRSWRLLNLTGFIFTFIIATAWGILRYQPEFFNSTEPFLILYYLMYLAVSILCTLKYPFKPQNLVDGTLVFGLPLVAFPLQVELVDEIQYAAAYSAVALGTLYLILAKLLYSHPKMNLLSQAFLALGVVFYTIAIPYAFDADLTAALWALESSAIIWIALKQSRTYARYFGEVLLGISILLYPISSVDYGGTIAFVNMEYLGYMIITISALISSYLLDIYRDQLSEVDNKAPLLFMIAAIIVWLLGGSQEVTLLSVIYGNAMLIYIAAGAFILAIVATLRQWGQLTTILQSYLPLGMLLIYTMLDHYHFSHPLAGIGGLAIGLFLLVHYALLYRFDKVWSYASTLHITSLWLITLIAIMEIHYHISQWSHNPTWMTLSTALIPLLLATVIMSLKQMPYREQYQLVGVGGLVSVLFFWELSAFGMAGDPAPLPYIPLLNPLDLIQIAGMGMIIYWFRIYQNQFTQTTTRLFYGVTALMLTLLSSVIFARAVHFLRSVDYTLSTLWDSLFFQAGLSILWSLLAIVLMLLAKHYRSRPLWLSGFGLLVVVVIKLFLVELSSSGTVERIISFLAVGSLLLLVGYFAPLPPTKSEEEVVES